MEFIIKRPSKHQIAVSCDGQASHTFELVELIPDDSLTLRPPHPLEDPVSYGKAVYQALFPAESLAWQTLDAGPERIFLVIEDEQLQAIPWEYTHSGEDFLVLEMPFVRGTKSPAWMQYFKDGKPSPAWIDKVGAVREILSSEGRTLAKGALAWLWARSRKTIPIPGIRTVKQAEENCKAMEFGPLNQEQLVEINSLLGRS